MRFDDKGKRIRPDGNGGGKDGKKFTDSLGTVDLTDKEDKEEHFGEIGLTEEARIKNAQRRFHARMTEREKEEATKWIAYYRYMVGEGEKE